MNLEPLPSTFTPTRESLRALACYVISAARKARTGHISLEPTEGGFGTPPFDDGCRISVRGDRLFRGPDASTSITTLRAASAFVGVRLSAEPGVGKNLPPYAPDGDLAVDAGASFALGRWYRFANESLATLKKDLPIGTVGDAHIWPEHFDLAATADLGSGTQVNVGMSPGDTFCPEPYAYVGPRDMSPVSGAFWNAPFGAFLSYEQIRSAVTQLDAVLRFVDRGLRLVASAKDAACE
jgi:hypothetical protein